MKTLGAAAALLSLAIPVCAVTIEVVITGPGRAAYAVTIAGVTKNGRLATRQGPVTFREAIDVTPRAASLPASLTFFSEDGPVAVCPPIEVAIEQRRSACTPSFTLVEHENDGGASCRSACERASKTDGDSDEWFVARAGLPSK